MIHRKWSLLTGPAAILGSIVATVIVANYLFVENVDVWEKNIEFHQQGSAAPFLKREPRKEDRDPSTK